MPPEEKKLFVLREYNWFGSLQVVEGFYSLHLRLGKIPWATGKGEAKENLSGNGSLEKKWSAYLLTFQNWGPIARIRDIADRLERATCREGLCPLSQVAPREVVRPRREVYHRLNLAHKQVLCLSRLIPLTQESKETERQREEIPIVRYKDKSPGMLWHFQNPTLHQNWGKAQRHWFD